MPRVMSRLWRFELPALQLMRAPELIRVPLASRDRECAPALARPLWRWSRNRAITSIGLPTLQGPKGGDGYIRIEIPQN
jgi:hypothetical protein